MDTSYGWTWIDDMMKRDMVINYRKCVRRPLPTTHVTYWPLRRRSLRSAAVGVSAGPCTRGDWRSPDVAGGSARCPAEVGSMVRGVISSGIRL